MAESLAALGVASNIVQFVELGFNITKAVIETYRSTDVNGLAERNVDLVAMTSSLKDRCTLLQDDAAAKADPITMGLLKRCIKVANELLSELEGLKMSSSERSRSLTRFVKSMKAFWKKSKIEDLAARIDDIKKEVFQRLEPLLHDHRKSLSEAMRSLGDASAAWNNATEKRLDGISRELQILLHEKTIERSPDEVRNFGNKLSRFADEAKKRGNIRATLKSLRFSQMKERQNEIPQAHRNTFQWIFDESSSSSFMLWLRQSGGGVFWVTGKPGSGKSTLMKLILGHQQTKKLVGIWADSKPLILVSHFFWSVGNNIQKSQEGLLRTLLFQIMVQCPEIIPDACPDRYLDSFRSVESWSIEELSQTFEKIRDTQRLPARILLLVDGLDEYNGEPRQLTKFLRAITTSPDIKVCCSSRPWPEFLEAFGQSRWTLQMHNLTKTDIIRYVEDNLSNNARFRTLREVQEDGSHTLVQTISERAEGVFFWVSLVVKSLLRGLRNHDNIDILQKRLAELPSDLHLFFQRMLGLIEDVYVENAFLVFTILLSAKTSLPLRLFRHLSDIRKSGAPELVESTFTEPMQDESSMSKTRAIKRPTTQKLRTKRANIVLLTGEHHPTKYEKDALLARCRDLVQAWKTQKGDDQIGFVHRTVFEFLLQTPSLQRFMADISIGHHCLFPMACFRDIEEQSTTGEEENDSLLRICHFFQELETGDIPNPLLLWNILCVLRSDSGVFEHMNDNLRAGKVFRLLGHAQASFLLQVDSLPSDQVGLCYADIVTEVLQGSTQVNVGEHPDVTWSDDIDLPLLADLLSLFEKPGAIPRNQFYYIWGSFVTRISSAVSAEPPPPNTFQACKIFVEHGAPRRLQDFTDVPRYSHSAMRLLDNTPRKAEIDVMERLQASGRFKNVELEELMSLFPPDRMIQRASTGLSQGFSQLFTWLTDMPGKRKT